MFTRKILIVIVVFCSNFIEAQNLTTGAAINKAGRQRMLSQRMAKNYMAIGAGIKIEDALRELDESSSSFNENLRDLENYSKNKDTSDAIAFVSVLWSNFRTGVLSKTDIDAAEKIIADDDSLMKILETYKFILKTKKP